MSIWTYLTASLCYTIDTNKHDYTKTDTISRERQRQTDTQR